MREKKSGLTCRFLLKWLMGKCKYKKRNRFKMEGDYFVFWHVKESTQNSLKVLEIIEFSKTMLSVNTTGLHNPVHVNSSKQGYNKASENVKPRSELINHLVKWFFIFCCHEPSKKPIRAIDLLLRNLQKQNFATMIGKPPDPSPSRGTEI